MKYYLLTKTRIFDSDSLLFLSMFYKIKYKSKFKVQSASTKNDTKKESHLILKKKPYRSSLKNFVFGISKKK